MNTLFKWQASEHKSVYPSALRTAQRNGVHIIEFVSLVSLDLYSEITNW